MLLNKIEFMLLNKIKQMIGISLLMLLIVSCQDKPSKVPGLDSGKAEVSDFSMEPNVRVALFNESDIQNGKSPELNYGSMDTYFITLDKITYMVDYTDKEDFKNLKKGEKLTFRAPGKIARKELNGQNYRVVRLNEL